MKIRISGTISESIVDGPGIRFVVFTQGCPHHCAGCHNPDTHDFNGGKVIDTDEMIEEMKLYPYMSGLTISGGEPFSQKTANLRLEKRVRVRGLTRRPRDRDGSRCPRRFL